MTSSTNVASVAVMESRRRLRPTGTNSTHSVSVEGPCEADADADGICDDVDPCVGELDACGICNGPGEIYECGCADIPEGDCDCDGNQLDALGDVEACEDADADGICDDVDPCVGELDACGVCNGPGEIYECGCADIPEGLRLRRERSTPWECGGDCAEDADADGICDDGTHALENSTHVASTTAPERSAVRMCGHP